MARTCQVFVKCSVSGCGRRHHTLMHNDVPYLERLREPKNLQCASTSITEGNRSVRLGFIPVRLIGPNDVVDTYAFLDNGSDSTLIDKRLAKRLGLTVNACQLNISTLHGTRQTECGDTSLELLSLSSDVSIDLDRVFVVERLPFNKINNPSTDVSGWSHLSDLALHHLPDDSVGILLGCDVPEAHWVLEQRIGGKGEPYAVKTQLGWVLRGPTRGNPAHITYVNSVGVEEISLKEKIAQMYELEFEDMGIVNKDDYSMEDAKAIKMLEESTTLRACHYVIGLPWRSESKILPCNRFMAEKRLSYLKRRLTNDPQLLSKYVEVMKSHLTKDYIRKVENYSDSINKRWYLPHHPVLNPNKPGKLRVVFDCAALFQGVSLNSSLLQGPDLANKLTGVLLRFRKHPIAVSADINEMFLQVHVSEKDKWALSFLWWDSGDLSKPPGTYELNSHPFGASSSPCCANYALQVERILNNRPLVPVYDDPRSLKSLSPSDLLLLRTNEGLLGFDITLRERYTRSWRQSQYLADVFWKRWLTEYVTSLQQRHKWVTPKRDLKVGDLVLVVNEQLSRGNWRKGLVTETMQSQDGHVRKVTVKTQNGIVLRDIRKVCLLEGDDMQ
ncbi:hypothetical protein B566_EDAN018985 [Ephemera danica]|nr:hypothetical protein B566_EDAN018985 [Ephemera danica]